MPGQPFTLDDEWTYTHMRLVQMTRYTPDVINSLSAAWVRDFFAVNAAQQTHNAEVRWYP